MFYVQASQLQNSVIQTYLTETPEQSCLQALFTPTRCSTKLEVDGLTERAYFEKRLAGNILLYSELSVSSLMIFIKILKTQQKKYKKYLAVPTHRHAEKLCEIHDSEAFNWFSLELIARCVAIAKFKSSTKHLTKLYTQKKHFSVTLLLQCLPTYNTCHLKLFEN